MADSKNDELDSQNTLTIGVIGAGPSGLSVLNAFDKELERLKTNKEDVLFNVICFDKQCQPGGLWNYNWQTSTDENGLPVHNSMYRHLWSNGPKECLEMADYSFQQHFDDKVIGSFPPRAVLQDYILGRMKDRKLMDKFDVRLNHHIVDVKEGKESGFDITFENLQQKTSGTLHVDKLVVATGHFSVPNMVHFNGFDSFNGRVLHSHHFRNAQEFRGQNVVVIGSSYSAEDIALQCWKFGAQSVTISYRTAPMGFKWPDRVKEVPLLKEIVTGHGPYGPTQDAIFVDGQKVQDIHAVILCTGYLHSFPFLQESIRLSATNILYPDGLYKGVVYRKNPDVYYIGMQDQWYTFSYFDVQALLAKDLILGRISLPNEKEMDSDIKKWREKDVDSKTDEEMIQFQTDYMMDIMSILKDGKEYVDDPKLLDYSKEFVEWEHDKHHDILTYRDSVFRSKISGKTAKQFHTPWAKRFDDSMEHYLG